MRREGPEAEAEAAGTFAAPLPPTPTPLASAVADPAARSFGYGGSWEASLGSQAAWAAPHVPVAANEQLRVVPCSLWPMIAQRSNGVGADDGYVKVFDGRKAVLLRLGPHASSVGRTESN